MNKYFSQATVLIILIILLASVTTQAQTIPSSPVWFETCSPQDMEQLLKNSTFDVNMVYEQENDRFDSETPLMHAVKNKNSSVTALLIKVGANVNATTAYPRQLSVAVFAVQNSNSDVLKLLIDAGANVAHVAYSLSQDGYGTTLLHHAESNPNSDIFRLLLENGAKPFIRSDMGGYTALMACARKNPNPEVISVLLEAGLKIDEQSDYRETALTIAIAENPNPEVIKLLIDKGGDLSIVGGISVDRNVVELAERNPALKDSPVLLLIKSKYDSIEK